MKKLSPEAVEGAMDPITLNLPLRVALHTIEGGGYWAEIIELPGCVAQADTLPELKANLLQAAKDWLQEEPLKTEEDAIALARLQGSEEPVGGPFPEDYSPHIPLDWRGDDE